MIGDFEDMTRSPKKLVDSRANARSPTQLDKAIGQLIRQRRMELGLRQEDLARRLNVTQHQLQKYEVGENRISASRLADCARLLDVPISWFFQFKTVTEVASKADVLSQDEMSLVKHFRVLSPHGRSQLLQIVSVLASEAD
jgi:transcriptional regulator with XRE-family HTH domain